MVVAAYPKWRHDADQQDRLSILSCYVRFNSRVAPSGPRNWYADSTAAPVDHARIGTKFVAFACAIAIDRQHAIGVLIPEIAGAARPDVPEHGRGSLAFEVALLLELSCDIPDVLDRSAAEQIMEEVAFRWIPISAPRVHTAQGLLQLRS